MMLTKEQTAHTRQLPKVFCHKTQTPPVIGGLPDDKAWAAAEATDAFRLLRNDAAGELLRPRFPTKLRCMWNADALYVAFECKSPDVWATKTQRDGDLWNEPVVEVFIDVLGSGKSFFEFQVNPLGTVYDSFVPDVKLHDDWKKWSRWNSSSLRTAVRVDGKLNDRSHRDKGWSAEFAIPFADLAQQAGRVPRAGDAWRVNFCRYDYSAELPSPELSCWAPVVKCFDDLANFGWLIFTE